MISIIVGLIAIGLLLYLVQMLPLDPQIQNLIRIVAIIAVVLWLITTLLGYAPGGMALR